MKTEESVELAQTLSKKSKKRAGRTRQLALAAAFAIKGKGKGVK